MANMVSSQLACAAGSRKSSPGKRRLSGIQVPAGSREASQMLSKPRREGYYEDPSSLSPKYREPAPATGEAGCQTILSQGPSARTWNLMVFPGEDALRQKLKITLAQTCVHCLTLISASMINRDAVQVQLGIMESTLNRLLGKGNSPVSGFTPEPPSTASSTPPLTGPMQRMRGTVTAAQRMAKMRNQKLAELSSMSPGDVRRNAPCSAGRIRALAGRTRASMQGVQPQPPVPRHIQRCSQTESTMGKLPSPPSGSQTPPTPDCADYPGPPWHNPEGPAAIRDSHSGVHWAEAQEAMIQLHNSQTGASRQRSASAEMDDYLVDYNRRGADGDRREYYGYIDDFSRTVTPRGEVEVVVESEMPSGPKTPNSTSDANARLITLASSLANAMEHDAQPPGINPFWHSPTSASAQAKFTRPKTPPARPHSRAASITSGMPTTRTPDRWSPEQGTGGFTNRNVATILGLVSPSQSQAGPHKSASSDRPGELRASLPDAGGSPSFSGRRGGSKPTATR
eukprot:TRINITY_DN26842_c0_g1_i1.p1 TRINITY_DN26842_c0_g1~~TRINITY_DN26842_c0_g1_i1.p1  ORF type:complete len:537 (-),score=75.57 TRINITY_DN26842_c0_g1_i1:169-1704(-)